MNIDFECPQCAAPLHAPEKYAGGKARCQACGTEVRIPHTRGSSGGSGTFHLDDLEPTKTSDVGNEIIKTACPSCKKHFDVELPDVNPGDDIRVACDHCGVEKKLTAFQKEYERQEVAERLRLETDRRERQRAEKEAKDAFSAELAMRAERNRVEQRAGSTAAGASVDGEAEFDLIGSSRGEIKFEGKFTPAVRLLSGERILDQFDAEVWDLGVLGWVFGYKRRMVLTTHRLFHFDKKIFDNVLEIIWLRQVKAVLVGQQVKGFQFALGLMIGLGASAQILGGSVLPAFENSDSWFLRNAIGLILLLVGVLIIFTARQKVMMLSAGEDKLSLKLTRLKSGESKRFVDKVFGILATHTR